MSFSGEVVAIHVAPEAGEPMEAVERVHARVGRGVDGARYATAAGTYSERETPGRQVTLIEVEALEAIEREQGIRVSAAESRRNVLTRGAALNHLVGHEFTVGAVRLRGVKLCEPCGYLKRTLGIDQLVQALTHRAGLNAEILTDGEIRVGDRVAPA